MNLMVVSEIHGLVIIAVDHELYVYRLDPVTLTFCDSKKFKKIDLNNDQVNPSIYAIYHLARNQ
jgi:hypothetical protein